MSRVGASARLTLSDVADACGVSRMTVSNAYSRPDQLSTELRERILRTAERLGYGGPSAMGRALTRGHSDVIGVLLTGALPYAFGDPGTVAFLHGVTEQAASAGLALQLIPADGAGHEQLVRQAAVDGLIAYSPPDDDPALAAALHRRLPTVIAGGPHVPGVECVTVDNRRAAMSAAEHLLGLGHRNLAVLTWRSRADGYCGPAGPERLADVRYEVFRLRLAGYQQAAEAVGDGVPMRVWEQPGNSFADGRVAGRALLDVEPQDRPTAVLACTDVLALGVLQAAAELGVRVPEDLSVVGFDDIEESHRASPPLTTVHQSLYEQGRDCARLLTGAPGEVAGQHLTELVVRETTAPPGGNR